MFDENVIREAVRKAISSVQEKIDNKDKVVVGVSQRHIHLSREHLDILFGKGYELTIKKYLMGREYASEECVTLVGPSLKTIEKVRVLGPVRANTQVEISKTDTFILKVSPPVRPSGKIEGSEKMVIVGPKGVVYLNEGVIIANRHIHLEPKFAEENGIKDNDPPTKEELAKLPNYVFEEIMAEVLKCEKKDSERKVEAEAKGNAKSTAKKSS